MNNIKSKLKKIIKSPQKAVIVTAILGVYVFVLQTLTGTICLIYATIGLPCPGCGLTRAYLSFFGLNVFDALYSHPLFWAVPIVAFVYVKRRKINAQLFTLFVVAVLIALTIVAVEFVPTKLMARPLIAVT
jgi:hypothetical protein